MEKPMMDGNVPGTGGISSLQQPTVQPSTPSEHYKGPISLSMCISNPGHEILRPKPRR